MTNCLHMAKRSSVVFLEPADIGHVPKAVITIQCRDCGAPFEFVGVIPSAGLEISKDARELSVSITITESMPNPTAWKN